MRCTTLASGALVAALAVHGDALARRRPVDRRATVAPAAPRRLAAADSCAIGGLVTDAAIHLVASLGDDEAVDAVRAALARVHHRLDAGDAAPVIARALADAGAAVDRLERAAPGSAADLAPLREVLGRAATITG